MSAQQFFALNPRLVYPTRTAIAAVLALLAAKGMGLPEVYWAPISAIIVVQSDFGSSLKMAWHRLAGTALGSAAGALVAPNLGRGVVVFGLGVFAIGLISAMLRLERPANRFAAIAFAVVLLVARPEAPWVIALHRFIEVSLGIVVGLLLTRFWPENAATQPQPAKA